MNLSEDLPPSEDEIEHAAITPRDPIQTLERKIEHAAITPHDPIQTLERKIEHFKGESETRYGTLRGEIDDLKGALIREVGSLRALIEPMAIRVGRLTNEQDTVMAEIRDTRRWRLSQTNMRAPDSEDYDAMSNTAKHRALDQKDIDLAMARDKIKELEGVVMELRAQDAKDEERAEESRRFMRNTIVGAIVGLATIIFGGIAVYRMTSPNTSVTIEQKNPAPVSTK